jgi:hypothetical protein
LLKLVFQLHFWILNLVSFYISLIGIDGFDDLLLTKQKLEATNLVELLFDGFIGVDREIGTQSGESIRSEFFREENRRHSLGCNYR